MSIAAPDWFKAAQIEWSLGRATVQHTSQLSRFVQTVDLLAWQWSAIVTLPPALMRDSGKYEALINSLAGGADTLALHHMARPYPLGTMRGTPTLSATAAQFANSLSVADAWDTSRRNLFAYSEDAASWATSLAAGCAISSNVAANPSGATTADKLIEGTANQSHTFDRSAPYLDGTGTYTMAVAASPAGRDWLILGLFSATDNIRARFNVATGVCSMVNGPGTCSIVGDGAMKLCVLSAPITNTSAPVQRMQTEDDGTGATGYLGDGVSGVNVWGMRLSFGSSTGYVATTTSASYAPGTLKAGDMIGVDGQLFQVKDDCTANSSGVLTVPLVNRSRRSITSGASVLWDKPTAEFYMMDPRSRSVYTPGFGGSQTIELVEKVG